MRLICLLLGLILSASGSSFFARNQKFSDFPEEPVSAFLKDIDLHEVVEEDEVIGRPLRDYQGQEPVSNKLETEIESVSKVGQPLDLKCKAKTIIKSCSWTSPDGLVFGMDNLPDGITAKEGDENVCHIEIKELTNDQLGKWTCQVFLDQVEQFQEAYLTATETVPVTDVRLPSHAIPELYTIHLTPFIILDNFTIEGHVSVDIDVIEDADNLTLHIKDIAIYENMVSLIMKADQTQVEIKGHGYDASREFYVVKASVQAGQKYSLNIGFLADLSDKLAGFYRSAYQVGNETRYIATSHMEPTDARRALPCFDEPALKAKFQMNLGRLRTMTSTSNMPMLDEGLAMADTDEYVWDTYETSVKMSTYLLAFVVSDFKYRTGVSTNNGVEFRIWSREEALEQTKYAADIGPKILQYYEDYFNVPFPLPKQDMIAIPDFAAGAMENWGLITYRETALLHDPNADAKSRRIYVSTVVAHELAHQWFGDLVTMKWWDDLWLNEGFASYVETIGAAHVEPEASILERFCIDNTYDTFEIDSLKTSHPISAKVKHPDEINQIFDRISYGKGASIIRMMYHFLGEETFVQGLTLYLNRHKYANAEQDDLWQALTEVAHNLKTLDQDLTVKQVMDTWTLQMGYPVLTVTRDYQANTMTIKQNRFMTGGLGDETNYKWWVPITYDHQDGSFNKTSNDLWLKPDNKDLVIELSEDFKDKAVIVNVQQTAYLRVNYDEQNWNMIIKALESNRLSIDRVNRGQIFNDLFNLAKEGQVSYVQAMDATKYLFSETDFIPWRSGLFSLKYIRLMLQRSPAYGLFKKYMTGEMVQPYMKLGLSTKKTDSIDDVDLRTDIVGWMCSLGYDDCQRQSTDLFKHWMDTINPDQDNPIDPSTRATVYCQAIQAGDEKEWNFLWNRLKKTSNANERNTIFRGLACTNEVWILQRYLDMTLDPESIIRKQDGSTVITSIARNSVGRYITWNWIRNKWNEVSTYFVTGISTAVDRGISAVTQDFNTPFELQELQQFYEDHKNELGTAKSTTLNAIENVKANVKWMDNYYQTINDWLEQNVGNEFSP